jgi:hypothetical protein
MMSGDTITTKTVAEKKVGDVSDSFQYPSICWIDRGGEKVQIVKPMDRTVYEQEAIASCLATITLVTATNSLAHG